LGVVGLLRILLAAVLLAAAAGKLLAARSSRSALRSYGVESAPLRGLLWGGTIMLETVLAAGVVAGFDATAFAAGALLVAFAAAQALAIVRGKAGAPCGCFGSRSKIGWTGVARNLALAAAFVALPFLPDTEPSTTAWLGIGLAVALVGLAALGVAVFALARELGELRLAVAPQAALSLEHEGPELGGRVALIERFERRAPLALAVFTSPGCSLCEALRPSLALLEHDPEVELVTFDEEADAEAWQALAVPGSPYAVALGPDGVVLAKGTFNSLYQLESVVAAALHTRSVRA
jgi:hypothetical protein